MPPVLPHNVKSGLHIPLRQTGVEGTDERTQQKKRKRWIEKKLFGRGQKGRKKLEEVNRERPEDRVGDVVWNKDGDARKNGSR